jgi:hypothetical protein
MNFKIGDKICFGTESFGKKIHRRGTVVEEHPKYYVIEVAVPAHKDSTEKTRTFRETIHKCSDMRAFAYMKGQYDGKVCPEEKLLRRYQSEKSLTLCR